MPASQRSGPLRYRLALGPIAYRDDSSVLPVTRPAKPVILYEYESSPFCRKVREICCLLDIECEMRPVPGARQGAFAQKLAAAGGKMTVPYLEDPNNADKGMYESDDIVEYLLDELAAAWRRSSFAGGRGGAAATTRRCQRTPMATATMSADAMATGRDDAAAQVRPTAGRVRFAGALAA